MQRGKKLALFALLCPALIASGGILLLTASGMLIPGCSPRDPGRPTREMLASQIAAYAAVGIIRMRQMEFYEDKLVNQNRNGRGEFGLLGELAGEIVPRGNRLGAPLANPLLTKGYKTGGAKGPGYAHRQGYYFRIYLPATPDTAGDDQTLGGTRTKPGPEVRRDVISLQEKHYALYAWPQRRGTIPKYSIAFFINEKGHMYRQIGTKYIGGSHPPPAEAAYVGRVFTSEIDTSEWTPIYGAVKKEKKKADSFPR